MLRPDTTRKPILLVPIIANWRFLRSNMELLLRHAARTRTAGRTGALKLKPNQGASATFQVAFYRSKKSREKDGESRKNYDRRDSNGRDKPRKQHRQQQQQTFHAPKQEQEELLPEPPRDLEKQWESMRARTMIVPPPVLPARTKKEIENKMRMRRLGLLNDDEDEGGYDYEAGRGHGGAQQPYRGEKSGFPPQQNPLHLRKNEDASSGSQRQPSRRAVPERLKQFTNMQSAPDEVVEREFLIPDEPENAKALDVAVIGRPNAGKSSIMNRLLNVTVSAVSAKYNTTRDRVLGILTEKDRQITFYDTPGIIKPKYVPSVFFVCDLLVGPWTCTNSTDIVADPLQRKPSVRAIAGDHCC